MTKLIRPAKRRRHMSSVTIRMRSSIHTAWNGTKTSIFYVNGKEYCRSNAGGVCQNPLYLTLSVEMWGENAVPLDRDADSAPADYIVDYVRAYQYNDLLN